MIEALYINSESIQVLKEQYTWSTKFLKPLKGLVTSSGDSQFRIQGPRTCEIID